MPLTKRQKEILDHIQSFISDHGYAPSFEEIAEHFGYSSLATVHEHLSNLERKGYIRKAYNESRSIELISAQSGPSAVELPLLGAVAAGLPIESSLGKTLYFFIVFPVILVTKTVLYCGILILSPFCKLSEYNRVLCFLISSIVILYFFEMLYKVSLRFTLCDL